MADLSIRQTAEIRTADESKKEQPEMSKKDRFVSVVVPVYNVSEYLDACIQSIVGQDHKDLEIILVDDGSEDDSLQKCRAWASKDSRIRVFSQENRGLSVARNVGVSLSTSQYVSFIDPDDVVEPDYVSVLYRAISDANADLSVAYLDIMGSNAPPSWIVDSTTVADGNGAMDLLCAGKIPISSCCKIYKTELLKDTPFIEGMFYEDNLFTYQMVGKCRSVAICKTVLYHHRMRSGSITHTVSVKNFRDGIKAKNLVASFLEEKFSSSDVKYLSKKIENWFDTERIYREGYVKVFCEKERLNVEAEQKAMRKAVISDVARARLSAFSKKVRIKFWVLKYAPRLCFPLYKTYQIIQKVHK